MSGAECARIYIHTNIHTRTITTQETGHALYMEDIPMQGRSKARNKKKAGARRRATIVDD
jgi:hypothetical protein